MVSLRAHPRPWAPFCSNDGDWVDSCSALVEHLDGRLEIVRWLEMAPAGANGGSRGARMSADAAQRTLQLVCASEEAHGARSTPDLLAPSTPLF